MSKRNLFKKVGFTLIEMMIFVTIVSIIFITLSALTAVSLRTSIVNESKILASYYSEQVLEWLRGEKEVDWTAFVARSHGGSINYCFNSEFLSWPAVGACSNFDFSLAGRFRRNVMLTYSPNDDRVTVKITVAWLDGARTFSVSSSTVYARGE